MPLSPAMETALEGPAALIFLAFEVNLPDGALRLLDGSGEVTFGGHTFKGADDTFGVVGGLEPFNDGVAAEAPSLQVTINAPTNTAAATLAAADAQGSVVHLWLGVLNPLDMSVIGDPYLLFSGELDQGVVRVSKGARSVTLECVSAWERFFEDDEGIRLNDAWHQSVWPGELGLEFVTETQRQLPWGQDSPTPAVISGQSTAQAIAAAAAANLVRSVV
jgi:hypothetical protein